MSTVTESISWAPSVAASTAEQRLPNRFTGMLLAVGASILLWSGIGAGIWALVDLVG